MECVFSLTSLNRMLFFIKETRIGCDASLNECFFSLKEMHVKLNYRGTKNNEFLITEDYDRQ